MVTTPMLRRSGVVKTAQPTGITLCFADQSIPQHGKSPRRRRVTDNADLVQASLLMKPGAADLPLIRPIARRHVTCLYNVPFLTPVTGVFEAMPPLCRRRASLPGVFLNARTAHQRRHIASCFDETMSGASASVLAAPISMPVSQTGRRREKSRKKAHSLPKPSPQKHVARYEMLGATSEGNA